MENTNKIFTPPFFQLVTGTDSTENSVKFVFGGEVLDFKVHDSKSVRATALMSIVAGFNHLLIWAKSMRYDALDAREMKLNEEYNRFKEKFLNKFCVFIFNMYKDMSGRNFNDKLRHISTSSEREDGRIITLQQAQSKVLVDYVEEYMRDPILMDGSIQYMIECSYTNSLSDSDRKSFKEPNLNQYDIFALMTLIPIFRILQLGFTMYHQTTKAESILYNPIRKSVSLIGERIVEYYSSRGLVSPTELSEMASNDYASNIMGFIEGSVNKGLKSESHSSVFQNVGLTDSAFRDRSLRTVLSAIYKILPVLDDEESRKTLSKNKDASRTKPYESTEEWEDYRYVSNCVINFITGTSKKIVGNNNKLSTNAISRSISADTTESNTSYKQEIYLEARNVESLKRKKRLVDLLNRWCEEKRPLIIDFEREFNISYPIATDVDHPFRQYMIQTVVNEVHEDFTATQIINKKVLSNLIVVVAYRLRELGYPNLSRAMLADSIIPNINSVDLIKHRMEQLYKYKINPVRTEKHIKDIISPSYKPQSSALVGTITAKDMDINISEEFLTFLKNREDGLINIVDVNIYKYDK